MASTVIGAIRVNLGMNSAEFEKDVKTINRKLDRFGRKLAGIGKAAAIGFAAVGAAAATAFNSISKHADKMTKAAQEIGIPVEDLTALTHAVELSGGSFDKLQVGIGRFAKNATDSMDGLKTEGTRALDSLGVALTNLDGSVKPTSMLIEEIADRFQAMPDGLQKTALAMNIFGKSGRDLIPLLNQGGAGIRAMTNEARNLGLVISQETGQQAERFNDNLTRIQGVLKGVAQAIFAQVVPTMVALSDRFVAATTQGGLFDGVIKGITAAFNFLIRVSLIVIENISTLYTIFKLFLTAKIAIGIISIVGTFFKLAQAIRVVGLTMGAFVAVQKLGLKGILAIAGAAAIATGQFDKLEEGIRKLWELGESLLPEGLKSSVEGMFADITGLESEVTGDLRTMVAASEDARASFVPLTQASSNLGKSLAKGNKGSVGEGAKDAWTGLRQVSDAAQTATQNVAPVAEKLQGAFGSWIDSAIDGTFNLKSALSDLAKSAAKMFAKKALGGLFGSLGFNFGGIPAFASGGSMGVGGTGGIDSQVRMIRASPNETIHVTKPGQSMGGAANVVLTVVGEEGRFFAPRVTAMSEDISVKVMQAGLSEYDSGKNGRMLESVERVG